MGSFKRVDDQTRRDYFNEWGLWEKVKGGNGWIAIVFDSHQPGKKAPKNLPPGTVSQEVHYFDTDGGKLRRRAIVHQYLQPDGTLGASGKPDPKWLMGEDGTTYAGPTQAKK